MFCSAVEVLSNAGNNGFRVADRRLERFKPSHSRLQTNTALKFAPKNKLVGGRDLHEKPGFWRLSRANLSFSFHSLFCRRIGSY
jgi:hypothetical protein